MSVWSRFVGLAQRIIQGRAPAVTPEPSPASGERSPQPSSATPESITPPQADRVPEAPVAASPQPEAIGLRAEEVVAELRARLEASKVAYPAPSPIPNWSNKKTSAGGVVLVGLGPSEIDRVYVVKPTNGFGGYSWVFPKGRVEDGLSREETALKEVREEAGIVARLMPSGYLGTGEGFTSITHYYMMLRVGGYPHAHEAETEEVVCVSLAQAKELFLSSGNKRDAEIADRAQAFVESLKERFNYA
jgi:8-oxo-dGTP pyrophosphatase MutT (NUDIX family)